MDDLITVRAKLWLEIDGRPFFGEGRFQLLKGIDKYGSINQAAKAARIPYRRAWSYLHAMEDRLGIQMIVTQTGGSNGGGTVLSMEAKEFLKRYEGMMADLEGVLKKKTWNFL
ncbi:MAG: winged helix-turn-helix domain-containing protein [Nitrospirae bacterium]|nr:winged helix-turn-helix domain-containing protein [Nitrospirota bacterium]